MPKNGGGPALHDEAVQYQCHPLCTLSKDAIFLQSV